MIKTRKTLVAASLALSLSATAACSSTDAADGGGESAELTMAITQSADSAIRATFQSLIDEFVADNPDVSITLLPASNEYESDMKVMMGANDLPDIFATHGWSVKRYSEFLVPLTDEAWAADVNPILDDAMRDENGDIYAFPAEVDTAGITYNASVLADAGVDVADVTTWAAFDDACQKIVATGASCITANAKNVYYPGNIANLMAPGIYTADQRQDLLDGTFPEEPWAAISDLISGWQQAGYFNPDYVSATDDDMAKALAQGTAAFAFTGNSTAANALSYNPDAELGYFAVPNDSGDPYLMGGEGLNALGVSKDGNVEVAKDFLAFVAQPENAAKIVSGTGNPSGFLGVDADLGSLQASFDRATENNVPLEPYFDRVYMPNGMWSTMCTAVDSLITGQGDTASSVSQVEAEYTNLYGAS